MGDGLRIWEHVAIAVDQALQIPIVHKANPKGYEVTDMA